MTDMDRGRTRSQLFFFCKTWRVGRAGGHRIMQSIFTCSFANHRWPCCQKGMAQGLYKLANDGSRGSPNDEPCESGSLMAACARRRGLGREGKGREWTFGLYQVLTGGRTRRRGQRARGRVRE